MKIRHIAEWEKSFYISLEPETVEEVAQLVRLGFRAKTAEGQKFATTHIYRDKTVGTSIFIPLKVETNIFI